MSLCRCFTCSLTARLVFDRSVSPNGGWGLLGCLISGWTKNAVLNSSARGILRSGSSDWYSTWRKELEIMVHMLTTRFEIGIGFKASSINFVPCSVAITPSQNRVIPGHRSLRAFMKGEQTFLSRPKESRMPFHCAPTMLHGMVGSKNTELRRVLTPPHIQPRVKIRSIIEPSLSNWHSRVGSVAWVFWLTDHWGSFTSPSGHDTLSNTITRAR